MTPTRQGSIRLFRLAGIDVFLHWSWLFIAIYQIQSRPHYYSNLLWPVLEYLSLFVIVLLHEFGHALACRQVGGQANLIVLWPFGGVAYVSPPQRPGATLWSIAAGPLVNVALTPVLGGILMLGASLGWNSTSPDFFKFIQSVTHINFGLLVFNILPIYPLDGGQILQSLLWFVMGRANSLITAAIIGIVGIVGLIGLAVVAGFMLSANPSDILWIAAIGAFILLNSVAGLLRGLTLARIAKAPRRDGFACPACQAHPPTGPFWRCNRCRQAFDTFQTLARCSRCGTQFAVTGCPNCGALRPFHEWVIPAAPTQNF